MMKVASYLRYLVFFFVNVPLFLQAQKRPNILVIFSDDHAQQAISAYGSKLMQTPGIDRIAKEGALFTNSFVTNSICAPSRAVLLTGKYGHKTGLVDNSENRHFDGSQQQVQKLLGAAGYQTAWIGKWHLQTLPVGFQYWHILPGQGQYYNPAFINMQNDTLRHEGYATDVITDFSLQWLDQRNKQQPFFIVIGHKASHREWIPDTKDLGAFDSVTFPLPTNFYDEYAGRRAAAEQDMTIDKTMRLKEDLKVHIDYEKNQMFRRISASQRPAFKAYYDKVTSEYEAIKNDPEKLLVWKYQRYLKDYLSTARSMDRNIERVLHYLDTSGLASNTVVIYTSDQGFYLGEHGWFDKRFMYEESLRTPLVMRYPNQIKPGTVVNDMVVNIDLTPTILQMAGCNIPTDIQGAGMMPLLTKQQAEWRKAMYYHYYEYPQDHRVAPHIGVRTKQHKLILFYGPFVSWELYDLSKDATEMNNLYGKPDYEKITAMLKQQLKQLAKQYEDTMAIELLKKEGL